MHTLLIKKVKILTPNATLETPPRDILIENGFIKAIQPDIEAPKAQIIDASNCLVSVGWVDIGAQVGEPGFEHRETLYSINRAAAKGGFTTLAIQPNTFPPLHSKPSITYIQSQTAALLADFYPIGALSKECKGQEISEIYDMNHAGVSIFSDGIKPIQNAGLMLRCLQYVRRFDGIVMNQPHDKSLSEGGQMHEGIISTSLGMKGIPSLAEEMMLQRDIYLLEYSASRLHVANISTVRSVELVRQAKAKGLHITASVAAINLAFEDKNLLDFDTNLKVLPPLRTKMDMEALLEGLQDGTIDFISSNHVPLDEEAKNLEFPYASFGAIGLETAFACINTYTTLSPIQIMEKLAVAPRKFLNIPIPNIAEGEKANLTIFDPNKKWTFGANDIFSISNNSPFLGISFTGKVVATINNGQII